jgi:hypothetical protein
MRIRVVAPLAILTAALFSTVIAISVSESGPVKDSLETSIQNCADLGVAKETECFSEIVTKTYEKEGLESASQVMFTASQIPGYAASRFAARCHDVAHALGKTIDFKKEKNLESRGPSVCRSGFFHGIHFQRFAEYKTPSALAISAPFVCVGSEEVIRVGRGGVGNGCRHALGHEFILRNLDPLTSARACSVPAIKTHNPESAVEDCLHGVYMEVFLTFEATENYTDPEPICEEASKVSKVSAAACLGEAGLSLFRYGLDNTPQKAFDICENLSNGDQYLAESCAGGLGRSAAAFLANDETSIKNYCKNSDNLYEACLVDAAAAVMEAEQDYKWMNICYGLKREKSCLLKMEDIKNLVETRE